MGEYELIETSIFENLAMQSSFLSAKMLNVNLQNAYLHWFSADRLICIQVNARYSKFSISYAYEASSVENVGLGGLTQVA